MFERFSEQARQVVVVAQDEARGLRHRYVGTEHLLLGLVSVEGVHRGILAEHGVYLETVRRRVGEIVGIGDEASVGQIPFTPRAKGALESALRQSIALGHDWIGPEHVLLGLCDHDEGVAVRLLAEAGLPREFVAAAVVAAMEARYQPAAGGERRCEAAFLLYGARFTCQDAQGHAGDDHVEHGDGWTMRWTRE